MKTDEQPVVEEKKKIFELLTQAQLGKDLTVRDDQFVFSVVLDATKICRRRGGRFRLIDTGKLSLSELEWLGEAGADIYTCDEARARLEDLDFLRRACRRGKAVVAYFHYGEINEKKENSVPTTSLPFLATLGQLGVYLHLSNQERERDLEGISRLASNFRKAGVWMVYYHHGPLDQRLGGLIREGAWLHLSDKSLSSEEDVRWLVETMAENSGEKPRLVLHLEQGLTLTQTLDLERTGAFLLFKTPPSDYRSAFYAIERSSKRRRLDFRSYYLYPTLLP